MSSLVKKTVGSSSRAAAKKLSSGERSACVNMLLGAIDEQSHRMLDWMLASEFCAMLGDADWSEIIEAGVGSGEQSRKVVKKILAIRGDWSGPLKDGKALWRATLSEELKIMEMLAKAGASLEEAEHWSGKERSPLVLTVERSMWVAAEKLIDLGALPDGKGGKAPVLAEVLRRGATELAEKMVAAGAGVNARSSSGYLPLGEAVRSCRYDEVRIAEVERLIQAGAEVDGFDGLGRTALMIAADCGLEDLVSCLLAKGARPGLKNALGESALMLAVEAGAEEAALRLLAAEPPVSGSSWRKIERLALDFEMQTLVGVVSSRKDAREIGSVAKKPRGMKKAASSVRI